MASAKTKKRSKKASDAPKASKPSAPIVETTEAPPLPRDVLDQILTLQLLIAWAGERNTDPPRLGWWRTSLVDEFGGEDLFKRLTPRSWKWAVLEAARTAARSVDADARANGDGDQLISLFHFGFVVDEQLDDRLAELKRSTSEPVEGLPGLGVTTQPWSVDAIQSQLRSLTGATVEATSIGRRLKGEMPSDQAAAARMLAAAMVPIVDRYPAPYFKVER